MSDTEFYTSIGVEIIAFYILPVFLFFYLKHLYKKYKKPKQVFTDEEIREYQKIKELEKLLKNEQDLK